MWGQVLPLSSRFGFCVRTLRSPFLTVSKTSSFFLSEGKARTIKHSIGHIRNHSKVSSAVVPESNLEVKFSEVGNDEIYVQSGDPLPPIKETVLDSQDNVNKINAKDVLNDVTVEHSLCRPTDGKDDRKGSRLRAKTKAHHVENAHRLNESCDQRSVAKDRQHMNKTLNNQEQILSDIVQSNEEYTNEKWEELRNTILNAGNGVNESNIDATIVGFCLPHKSFNTGLSYINFLKASGQEPNVSTVSKFLKLSFVCSSKVNDEIKCLITCLYDSLRSKYPTLDATTAENVLHGICVTERWKEGFDILDEIRLTCTPSTVAYSVLIKASFDNDNPDTGWDLISKMMIESRKPLPLVYESWVLYCKRTAAGNKEKEQHLIEKLLYFLANNDVRLSEEVAIMLRTWFEYDASPEEEWNVEFTTVDSRGMCKSCHQYLKSIAITKKEFESLRSMFIDKTIVGTNVFLKSTPEELKEFQDFIKKTAPFDVIIDGLNVAYGTGSSKGNPRLHARMLQSVVQHFVHKSQKVLVLGRRHMYNWPREYMDYIYENAEVFLTHNLSQDDPYLLYAAMYSGLGTRFISRDLMRGHAFLLRDAQLHSCFVRWQKQHQYHVLHVGDDGHVRFRPPQKISTSPQRNSNGSWHVPYDLESDSTRNSHFNPPRQWLCLTHARNRKLDDDYEDSQFKNSTRDERFYR